MSMMSDDARTRRSYLIVDHITQTSTAQRRRSLRGNREQSGECCSAIITTADTETADTTNTNVCNRQQHSCSPPYWYFCRRKDTCCSSNNWWFILVAILFTLMSVLMSGINGNLYTPQHNAVVKNGICPSKYIRNWASDLERLRGCRVIEGNLQISWIQTPSPSNNHAVTPANFANYSFPDLREVTGYVLLAYVNGLQTLRHIFPNLAVIRGQDLIYNYALLVSEMPDMQEVGLPALTNILSHGAWVFNNPNLCYVDTVDWSRIVNESAVNTVQKNKPNDQCPNLCPSTCPKSIDRQLCWSNKDCQIVSPLTCSHCGGRPCSSNRECCHEQCLGGCTGPSPKDCFVCKRVEHEIQEQTATTKFERVCMSSCPGSTYEYLGRRCVTAEECRNLTSSDPKKADLKGKTLTDKKMCVLECPKNYEPAKDEDGYEVCKRCEGICTKDCRGAFVESVESSVALKGCTRITGSLKIQIRGYSPNLVKELEHNLDMIEEIEDSLVVANSLSLVSLNFLKSLKMIRGKKLEEDRYALIVKSNENIQELWNTTRNNRTVEIGNKNARVLFHYNPKLCPNKILDFVQQSGIRSVNDTKMDIGSTNGDKVPCNQEKLIVEIVSMDNTSVTIRWNNFRRNLKETNHLLNYEVYYKEASQRDVSLYEDRDPCGYDDWKVMDVPKLDHKGAQEDEPIWEHERLISGLKYYTQYALYVKTVVIPDETSPNNNTGAQSDIIYFTSLPGKPSPPVELSLTSNSSNGIIISWYPPDQPNGLIEKYQIYLHESFESADFQDQRDYCKGRPESLKRSSSGEATTTAMPLFQTISQSGSGGECCSCSSVPEKKLDKHNAAALALLEMEVSDAIMNVVFIPNPDYNEDVESNIILSSETNSQGSRRRRRRRNALANDTLLNDTRDDSKEGDYKEFPLQQQIQQQLPDSKKPILGKLVQEIFLNQTSDSNAQIVYYLGELEHFSTYTIGVRACRQENSSNPRLNDTRVCSDPVSTFTTTLPSYAKDMVDQKSISINVTGNDVEFSWEEPTHPNGIVMAYRINVSRVDAAKSDQAPVFNCITRKRFNETGRNYTLPDKLLPGNYSLRIQVISLAHFEANYTEAKYFMIMATDVGMHTGTIIAIVIPFIVVCVMGIVFVLYCIKTNKHIKTIISANPVYAQNVDIPEEFEIPRDKIELGKELGQGSFGMVYEGFIRDFKGLSKLRCAIKTVSKDASSDDRFRFLKEAQIMTQLNCHHVVKLIGVVSVSQPTYVIMELMALGDLKKYLRLRRPDNTEGCTDPPPTLKQILQMAASIADGMAYLDSHKFVHRDLAARNCMVADDVTVKVADFGMTRDVVETDYYRKATRGLLPVRWMAPESIRDGVFTSQSDVWSFGVVLWEMATLAAQPYQGLSNEQVLRYVSDGQIMERPENCPDILADMMSRCWQSCPRDRPTFIDIVEWLLPDVDHRFAEMSFYHSEIGAEYRRNLQAAPPPEEEQIPTRAPLRATFDEDVLTEDEDDHLVKSNSNASDHHDRLHVNGDRRDNNSSSSRAGSHKSTNLYPDESMLCSSSPGMDQQPLLSSSYGNSNENQRRQPTIISPTKAAGQIRGNNNNRSTNSASDFISLDLNQLDSSASVNNGNLQGQSRESVGASSSSRSSSSSPKNLSSSNKNSNSWNNINSFSNDKARPPFQISSNSIPQYPLVANSSVGLSSPVITVPTTEVEPVLSVQFSPSKSPTKLDENIRPKLHNGIVGPLTQGKYISSLSSPTHPVAKPLVNGFISKNHNSSSSSIDKNTKTTEF